MDGALETTKCMVIAKLKLHGPSLLMKYGPQWACSRKKLHGPKTKIELVLSSLIAILSISIAMMPKKIDFR
jgi:hypothetical protein